MYLFSMNGNDLQGILLNFGIQERIIIKPMEQVPPLLRE